MHLKPKWKTFLQVSDGNTVNYYELLFYKHFLSSKNQEIYSYTAQKNEVFHQGFSQ